MGETEDEVHEAMKDLRDAGTDILTITQYLRPTSMHHPIERWVKPEEFVRHSEVAYDLGFPAVMSGPLVRSSYRSGRLYAQAMKARGREIPANLAHLNEKLEGSTQQEANTLIDKYGESADTPVVAR